LRWQDKGSLAASLRITHHARQTRTNFSDGEFFVPPSATVVDVIGRWRPISTAEVFFGLYNIADRKYWRYSDAREFVPGDPRIEARIRTRRNAAITFHLNL
jgi:hemoglobin/transferrin/lactoferrin receptor protein